MSKIRDLAGQVFGKLTAQALDGKDPTGKMKWKCACECGNTTSATMLNLVKGITKSCGCLRHRPAVNRLELAGQRFGMLTAKRRLDSLKWECVCDCGVITAVRTVHLSRRHTQSCGCISKTTDSNKAALYKMRNTRTNWSVRVKDALGAICASCGTVDKLHSHHILPYKDHPHVSDSIENGIVLCHTCHWQVHKAINQGQSCGQAIVSTVLANNAHPDVQYLGSLLRDWKAQGGVQDLHQARRYIDEMIATSLDTE
jgi:hypothetical protein